MKTTKLGKCFVVNAHSNGQQMNVKGLAKQSLTPEMQRRDSNIRISREFRGSIQRVQGVKESYPHTAKDKLQMRNLWSA
jgi:hypothetical protein